MSVLSPSVAALRRLAGLSLAAFAQASSDPAPRDGSWIAKAINVADDERNPPERPGSWNAR